MEQQQFAPPPGLSIRRVPIASLHQDPANARAHGEENMEAIVASLRRFGQAEPLVVQQPSGRVIGGNGRLAAMQRLGWTEADVVELEVDDLTATALGIALNRTGELAEWDASSLTRLLQELQTAGELDGVGFDDADIAELLAGLADLEEPADLDDPGPGEPPEDPVTREGDLWLLGGHRLLCGDATNPEHVARLMAGEKATLFATDPPYLVDYQGGNHPQSWANRPETRDKHWDDYQDPQQGVDFFTGFLRAGLAHCVGAVPVYQWHAHRRQALVERAWEDAGLLVHQQIIWTKARPVLTRSHYMWQHEPCFYGWRKGSMPPKERRPPNNATTVWAIDQVGQQDGIHPTQKPLDIFARPISYHTRPEEVVLETFSGSGTQIIAAESLGRRCFALEISPAFVDVAIRRWQQAAKKEAVLDGAERTFAEVEAERGERMSGKIPDGAFDFYVGLGPQRSYRAVASRYGVTKRAVTKHAQRHGWSARLEGIESEARERSDERLVEMIDDMRERHVKMLEAMAARAIEAIKRYPLTDGMQGMKAGEMTIKLERIIAGEPSERTEMTIEEVTKREIQTLLVHKGAGDDDDW